jgi:hypothetical protein
MPTDIIFEIKIIGFIMATLMLAAVHYAIPKIYEEAVKPGNEFLKKMWAVEGEEKAWVKGRRRYCAFMGVLLLVILITL